MNFGTLKSEVIARGFDFQDSTRVGRWVNQAYTELCDQEDWPFLRATATGPAPLAISNLGVIKSVRRADKTPLEPEIDPHADYLIDLPATGTALYYYLSGGSTVTVAPLDTGSITVRYWQVPTDLVSDVDVPIVPARFHELIVLGALRRAALEESDAGDYQGYDAEWLRGLQTMRERMLLWHRDGNFQQVSTVAHGDG